MDSSIDDLRTRFWLRPDDPALACELAQLLLRHGQAAAAIETLQTALRRQPDVPELQQALGQCWQELAEWEKAQACYEQAGDTAALAQLQAARGNLPPSYARHLFNDYAPRFDEALARLGYQAPQLIMAALAPYLQTRRDWHICDLGCGTGLLAPFLRPYAARLVGVDLSENMLEQAQQRGGYDELVCADVVEFFNRPCHFGLITAADVLVYLGDLAPLFAALPKGALFAATVEVNGLQEHYKLQDSKRYAHSRAYIEATAQAAGHQLLHWQEVVLRQDRGQPVVGAVMVCLTDA